MYFTHYLMIFKIILDIASVALPDSICIIYKYSNM